VGQKIEYIDISVWDYLIMGRMPYFKKLQLFEKEQDIKIVEYYAEYLGITKFLSRRIFELSGGERQYRCNLFSTYSKTRNYFPR